MKIWSDNTILKSIDNPSDKMMEIKISTQEVTFLGAKEQPDFAKLTILFTPSKKVIELKSLKKYLFQFRNKLLSYERLVNVLYNDIQDVYKPCKLKISLEFKPRGGITSEVELDSEKQIKELL